VVRVLAHGTVHRIIAGPCVSAFTDPLCPLGGRWLADLPRAVAGTSLARLNRTGQLLAPALLHQNVLPALVEHLFDVLRYVDDLRRGDDLVILLNITVIQLLIPEAVGLAFVFGHVWDLALVPDLALAAQGCQRVDLGVHRGKNQARVLHLTANVLWSVVPIDAKRVNWF